MECEHYPRYVWRGVGGLRGLCSICIRVYLVKPGIPLAERQLDPLGWN